MLSMLTCQTVFQSGYIIFGEGNGTPLHYSCLENPVYRGAWWAAVHGVAKSRTWLSDFTFTSTQPTLLLCGFAEFSNQPQAGQEKLCPG